MNEQIVENILKQAGKIPEKLEKRIRELFPSDEVLLYAQSDLDGRLNFKESWVVLTNKNLLIFKDTIDSWDLSVQVDLSKVAKVKETWSMSCTTVKVVSADDQLPLASWAYTGRQKVTMGNLVFALRLATKGDLGDLDKTEVHEDYRKSLLKPITDARSNISSKKGAALFRLLGYLKPYKKEIMWGGLGATLSTAFSLLPAFISGRLIDQVIKPFQDEVLTKSEAFEMAYIFVGALALTYVFREISIWLRLNKMSIMGEKVAEDLRSELYAHLQKLSMKFFSSKQTGSIISRVSSDTDRIWDFIAFGVIEVGIALLTLIGLTGMLLYLDWKLGLVMSLPVPILLYSIVKHGEHMKRLFLRVWRKWTDVTNVLSDTIPGIQVVKAFGQENREINRFVKKNRITTVELEKLHAAWTAFWPKLMLGIQSVTMVVWILAIPRLLSETSESTYLSAGTFVSFLLYMTMFAQPIEVIGQMARMLNRALSSALRIFEILDTEPDIVETENPVELTDVKGEVEFKNVRFSYDGIRPILKNVSFNVRPGEMIGLVGPSGGGKSTITKLIARFYDVQGGGILIDGVPLKDLELNTYRRQVGMVLQDPYLFHGTILENIRYGVPEATLEEVIEAAKVANAHDFILKLPYGYETVVGERGHTLSGGERQRVSIARAILSDPKILVLDEATSAVDTETERNIQEALDRLIEGRTVFAVAHRLSTLRQADRIFVVKEGQIEQEGSHESLLKDDKGLYYKLHKMQKEMGENFAL